MAQMGIKKGDKVVIEYEGRFEDGQIFDSSNREGEKMPINFVVGEGQVIPGFEEAVIGMEKGDEKEIKISKEEAYGDYKSELKQEFPKTQLPEGQEIKEGSLLVLGTPEGKQVPVKVLEVKKESFIIDLNHPLAGKNLIFKIKVTRIEVNSE